MGMNLSFYVGALIEFPVLSFMEKVSIKRCSNQKCKNHARFNSSAKFCPDCGQVIENHNYTHSLERPLCLEDLNAVDENIVEWTDVLSSVNDLNVYTSNMQGNTGIWFDNDDAKLKILSPDDFQSMKALLTEQLIQKGFFNFVEQNFSFTPEVKFGTFSEWR